MGKQRWCEHLKDIKLSPSHAGAGGTYNGQDLKAIIQYDNLQKLKPKIPNGEVITDYMHAINNLHMMCVAKSVVPYDVWGICARFRDTFTKVYKLGLGLSATPKIHICWTHIPEWFEIQTGLETLYTADCSNFESCHRAIKTIEQSRNLEIKTNRGSDRERRALESTLAHHNFSTDIIPGPLDQVAEVDTAVVTEELQTLVLSGDTDQVPSKVYSIR